jgi:hypothetical protein
MILNFMAGRADELEGKSIDGAATLCSSVKRMLQLAFGNRASSSKTKSSEEQAARASTVPIDQERTTNIMQ